MRDISISPDPPSHPTLTNIARLPPKMLITIFVHLLKQELGIPGHEASYSRSRSRLRTHERRSWRQIAITAPKLWTEITAATVHASQGGSPSAPINEADRYGFRSSKPATIAALTCRLRALRGIGHCATIFVGISMRG